jgi:hypothetical protein
MCKHGEFKYSLAELDSNEALIRKRLVSYFELLDRLTRKAA